MLRGDHGRGDERAAARADAERDDALHPAVRALHRSVGRARQPLSALRRARRVPRSIRRTPRPRAAVWTRDGSRQRTPAAPLCSPAAMSTRSSVSTTGAACFPFTAAYASCCSLPRPGGLPRRSTAGSANRTRQSSRTNDSADRPSVVCHACASPSHLRRRPRASGPAISRRISPSSSGARRSSPRSATTTAGEHVSAASSTCRTIAKPSRLRGMACLWSKASTSTRFRSVSPTCAGALLRARPRRRLGTRHERPRLCYRDVAGASNRLTLIAAILPAGCVSTHTVFCLRTPLAIERAALPLRPVQQLRPELPGEAPRQHPRHHRDRRTPAGADTRHGPRGVRGNRRPCAPAPSWSRSPGSCRAERARSRTVSTVARRLRTHPRNVSARPSRRPRRRSRVFEQRLSGCRSRSHFVLARPSWAGERLVLKGGLVIRHSGLAGSAR